MVSPIYGREGKNLKALNSKSFSGSEKITLSEGKNILQVVAMNNQGVRSLIDQITIKYEGSAPSSQTHLVLIGTSDFSDKDITPLDYPSKDLQDIEAQFKTSATHKNLKVHRLLGQDFTLQGVQKLKADLSKTKVDDKSFNLFCNSWFP